MNINQNLEDLFNSFCLTETNESMKLFRKQDFIFTEIEEEICMENVETKDLIKLKFENKVLKSTLKINYFVDGWFYLNKIQFPMITFTNNSA